MSVVDSLVDKKLIWFNTTEQLFHVDCKAHIRFEFTFEKGHSYELKESELVASLFDLNECIVLITAIEPQPYTDVATWHIGNVLTKKYCQSFNFNNRTMALSDYM